MKKLLLLLLFVSLSFASTDENDLGEFFNDTTDRVNSETTSWVAGQTGGVGGVVTVFSSVYDAFSPAQCGDQWITGTGFILDTWIAPTVAVLMVVVFGVTIVYLLGQLLNIPNLIALAKDEYYQVGFTVIRVVIIIGMIAAGETWFALAAGSGGTTIDPIYDNPNIISMMDGAMAFARLMVSDMVKHYSMLIMYNMIIHTIYSSTMWFGVTWRAMYSFNLGPVLKPLIDILGTSLQFLSLGISEWMLHLITLCIIKKWAWGLFIPLGLLMRSFPYTRNGGEALLALMFALVLFYPFMFLFDYEVHKLMKGHLIDAESAMSGFIHKSGILSVFGSVLIVMFLMAGVFVPFFLGGALSLAFELIRGAVYYIVIMSLLLPFLNIFVTLTAAKESANFFRVDVNLMSFLKII